MGREVNLSSNGVARDRISIAQALARAKSRQDLDATMGIYHPDAALETPAFGSTLQGGEAIRRGLLVFFRLAPDYAVALDGFAEVDETLVAAGRFSCTPFSGLARRPA